MLISGACTQFLTSLVYVAETTFGISQPPPPRLLPLFEATMSSFLPISAHYIHAMVASHLPARPIVFFSLVRAGSANFPLLQPATGSGSSRLELCAAGRGVDALEGRPLLVHGPWRAAQAHLGCALRVKKLCACLPLRADKATGALAGDLCRAPAADRLHGQERGRNEPSHQWARPEHVSVRPTNHILPSSHCQLFLDCSLLIAPHLRTPARARGMACPYLEGGGGASDGPSTTLPLPSAPRTTHWVSRTRSPPGALGKRLTD